MGSRLSAAAVGAWLLVAVYYFYQYALRSAPSVMMPELTEAFGVNALGVSAIVGMFYYGYSPFSSRWPSFRTASTRTPATLRGRLQASKRTITAGPPRAARSASGNRPRSSR
jgi:hypothetical protein